MVPLPKALRAPVSGAKLAALAPTPRPPFPFVTSELRSSQVRVDLVGIQERGKHLLSACLLGEHFVQKAISRLAALGNVGW
jgi:hypothetical protein